MSTALHEELVLVNKKPTSSSLLKKIKLSIRVLENLVENMPQKNL
jgi:hypothetical protein